MRPAAATLVMACVSSRHQPEQGKRGPGRAWGHATSVALFYFVEPREGANARWLSIVPCHPSPSSSPQPPSPPPSPRGPAHRHHNEMCVIPLTPAMDQAEVALANALVAMVGGTRPVVSPSQVVQLLSQHYLVESFDVQVKWHSHADFLLVFSSR
jgi:hypothetical protein